MSVLNFKVYAGNMFCGYLSVFSSGTHLFTNSALTITHESGAPILGIKAYKNLKLQRVS